MKPYKTVAALPGMANIVDRATGRVVGCVLTAATGGWEGFVKGQYEPVVTTRFRSDAAAKVWEAHTARTRE